MLKKMESKIDSPNALGKKELLAAALSGAAVALGFPDYNLWPAPWIGLAPLFFVLRGKPPHHGAFLGMAFGIAYFGMTITWMINTMTQYGGMPMWLAVPVTALAVVYASVFPAVFGYFFSRLSSTRGPDMALAAAPFLWVATETLRGVLPPIAFPWARIADTQYTILPIIQIADIFGEEGLCFLIALVNAVMVKLVDWAAARRRGHVPFPAAWAGLAAALVALALVYGQARLGAADTAQGPGIPVALVQGNIDQGRKWESAYRTEQVNLYVKRTRAAAADGASLVIWPETAAPFYFGQAQGQDRIIYDLAGDTGATIVFGSPGFKRKNDVWMSYNRAWIVRPGGLAEKYDKLHLVPFGEYVPLRRLLFFVEKMVEAVGDLRPGDRLNLLHAEGYTLGAQICFEIIFPRYSRQIAAEGGSAIVNITNDSWFGPTAASRQSLAMAVFRAVENRIPVLRAAQSGVSAIVTATGAITGQTGLFVETTLMGEFTPRTGPPTVYTSAGWVFGWLCVGGAAVFALLSFSGRRTGP